MKYSKHIFACLLALVLAATLAACGPEAGRARGGGKGADVGNIASDFKPRSKIFPTGGGEGDPK